jgi:hypothetical protein
MGSRLSSMLVQEGLLRVETLKEMLALQVIKGGQLDTILLEKGLLSEATITALLSRAMGFPPLTPELLDRAQQMASLALDERTADRLGVCPIYSDLQSLSLLVSEATDHVALEELAFELDRRLLPVAAPEVRVLQARQRVFGTALAQRFVTLLSRLGEAPPIAAAATLVKPSIEPRRSRSQPGEAAATASTADAEPPSAARAQTSEHGYSLLEPLMIERDQPVGAATDMPPLPEITDEYPPLRDRLPRPPQSGEVPPLPEPAAQLESVVTHPPPDMPPIPPDADLEELQAAAAIQPEDLAAAAAAPGEDLILADHDLLPDAGASQGSVTAQKPAESAEPEAQTMDAEPPPPVERRERRVFSSGPLSRVVSGEITIQDKPSRGVEPQVQLVDEATVVEAPVVEAPVVESLVVDEATVVEATVVESLVVDEATVVETPVVEAPVDEAPVDEATVVEATVVEAPAEEPVHAPLPLAEAGPALVRAQSRDELLLTLARAVHQYLECVQVYLHRHGELQGQLELASGHFDSVHIRQRRLATDVPSIISRAIEDGSLYIGPVPVVDASASLLLAAGVLAGEGVVLAPVHLKGRNICLVVGHSYDRPIPPRVRIPIARLVQETALALARLIVRQKQTRVTPATEPAPALAPQPEPVAPAVPAESPKVEVSWEALPPEPAEPWRVGASRPTPGSTDPISSEARPTPPVARVVEPRPAPGGAEKQPHLTDTVVEEQPIRRVPTGPMPRAGYVLDTVRSLDSRSGPQAQRPGASPEPASASLPALIDELEAGGTSAQWAELQLRKLGATAIAALIGRFPGRLRHDRFARNALPPVTECSPVLKALASFGRGVIFALAPLFHHKDADVRYYVSYLMSELVYPEAVALLSTRLQDKDHDVRRIAAATLGKFRQMEQFPNVLLDLRADLSNPDPRPRRAAAEALAALGDGDSVPLLLDLLADPEQSVVESALNALVTLTKQDYARNEKKWRAWWERNNHRHRMEWLIEGLVHKAPDIRAATATELEQLTGLSFGYSFDMPRREREAIRRRFVDWWAEIGMEKFKG